MRINDILVGDSVKPVDVELPLPAMEMMDHNNTC